MSMEEQIRQRHELEDRVRWFIDQIEQFRRTAKRMTVRSLEIAMARLIDKIDASSDEAVQLDYKFKGLLLKPIYDDLCRTPPKKKGFFVAILSDPAPEPSQVIGWEFRYPFPIKESSIKEWADCEPLDPSRLLPPPDLHR